MRFLFCVTQIFYKIRKQAHKYLTEPVFRRGRPLCHITRTFPLLSPPSCTLFHKKSGITDAVLSRVRENAVSSTFPPCCLEPDAEARRGNQKPPFCPAEVLIQAPPAERCRLIDKGGLGGGQSDSPPRVPPLVRHLLRLSRRLPSPLCGGERSAVYPLHRGLVRRFPRWAGSA